MWNSLISLILPLILVLTLNAPASSPLWAAESTTQAERIAAQLKAAGRDQYDAIKDPGRKPSATMAFAGVKAGMTVLDLIAGGGYNTEILAAAVGPQGLVYAQNSHLIPKLIGGEMHDAMLARLTGERLPNVRYLIVDAEDMPFEDHIDLAFWGLNMHDLYHRDGAAAVQDFLKHVRRALKPQGILIVTEQVGIDGQDNAELHRLQTPIVLDMLEQAGFTVAAVSDLLANPDDDHTRSVFADGLRYYTDRVLIRAVSND